MKRRDFFKATAGFVAGICAACVPKTKADIIIFPAEEKAREFSQKRIEPEVTTEELDDMMAMWMAEQRVRAAERMAYPAYVIHKDGSYCVC